MPFFTNRPAAFLPVLHGVFSSVWLLCCLAGLLLVCRATPCLAGATCSLHVRDCAEAVRPENRPADNLEEGFLFDYTAVPQSSRLPLNLSRPAPAKETSPPATTASDPAEHAPAEPEAPARPDQTADSPAPGSPAAASPASPVPADPRPAEDAAPGAAASGDASSAGDASPSWRSMEDGVEYASLPLPLSMERQGPQIAMLRLNPDKVDFLLCAIGREGHQALTLSEWGERKNLVAAINASMYLPDGTTSTGYMRDGDYTNNSRLVRRFGAFFLARPDRDDLPRATVIDKTRPDWQEMLSHYELVIQNYRLVDANRQVLWNRGGPWYSISAIGQDGKGNILFLHCREPIEAATFARGLLLLPLDIRTVMYVEGGGQAGLLLRSRSLRRELVGRRPTDFLATGNLRSPLPNVLGARLRLPESPAQPH